MCSTQATPIIIEQNSFQKAILKYSQVELGGHIFQQLITELGRKEEKYKKISKKFEYIYYILLQRTDKIIIFMNLYTSGWRMQM